MSAPGPSPLEVRADRTRLSFDGRRVTVRRRDRSVRQYALADFHYLRLSQHGTDSFQVHQLDMNRNFRTIERLTIRKTGRPYGLAQAIVATVNEARAQRVRAVLERTVGIGPWPAETWDEIRSLIMLQGYSEPWPLGSAAGESGLLRQLASALAYLAPDNRHGRPEGTPRYPELGGFTTPTELLRSAIPGAFGEVWNGVITALEGDRPVTEDRGWDRIAADLLRWGHDQVDRHRAGRPLTRSPHGRPSWAVDD